MNEELKAEIGTFFQAHLELTGLTYPGLEIIMKEKDPAIKQKAIKQVAEELIKRRDVTRPSFCFVRRNVTENQIRKILQGLKPKKPSSGTNGIPPEKRRSEVTSFRATPGVEDAIGYLAKECDVPKSFLINTLITIKRRYGFRLK
jgi:predicted metal-dependent RNase